LAWLTVPVLAAPQRSTKIKDVRVASTGWTQQHLKTLRMAYSRAPFFAEIMAMVADEFRNLGSDLLSDVNVALIRRICRYLGISTAITTHHDHWAVEHRQFRLRDICLRAGGSVYVSGPAARSYLDESVFQAAGIEVEWFDYSGYSEYLQLWGPFVHEVSILDLLFSQGPNSASYLNFGHRTTLSNEVRRLPLPAEERAA
jgi:hypothetical protein